MKIVMIVSPYKKGERIAVPVCAECDEPIIDFEEGNACPIESTYEFPVEFEAYHWPCEPAPHTYPWMSLANIFNRDQRLKAKDGGVILDI